MKKQWMKALSFVLALVMVLSIAPVSFVSATETEETPAGSAGLTYEPWGHGYRFVDVLNWDPATDPYSDELVAEVPLQTRIDTYAATQANPELTDRAKLYAISSSNYRSTDVNEAPWNAGMAYDEFSYNLFKFWQYTDMTGAGGRPTADIERGAGDKEYGTIAIPMAAATNAAHKNGVLSIAEYFLPRNPQYTEEWLQKDENGSFPYADKLIEIMEYYGFDGYFINQEEAIPQEYVPLMKEVMQYMRDRGAYIQWYDSLTNSGSISYQNIFNSTNSDFVYDTTHGYGQVSDSIFLNYWYSANAIKKSAEHAESLGLDPYEAVYMGLEGGEWRFGIDLEDFWDIMYNHNRHSGNLMQENGQPYTSFAIWGSDFYREQYNKADNDRYKVEYQWEADERERMYFTSPAEIVGDYDTSDIRREDLGFTYEDASTDKTKLSTQTNFKGISRYVVEKSVIGGTVFATDFNTGHGMNYYQNGEVVRDTEWSNLNLQDILPTWQWMLSSSDDVLLDLEWDYGPEYTRVQGEFPYTQIGGYNGGNSLAIYGSLNGNDSVMLYKTDLQILEGSRISLTYNKVSPQLESHEMIVLLLKSEENEDEVEAVTLPLRSENGGWKTADYSLSRYAGRTVAAIGLIAMGTGVENYQINLGRLEITDGTDYTPAAPENVYMELALPATGEYQIAWDLASYDEVKNYHVYAVYGDGSYGFVGGAYADEWYVSSLENESEVVALEVRAVGADGSESEGVQVAMPDAAISDVRTVSANNELIVTWTGGEAEVELSYWYSNEEAPAARTGNGTVTFPIAVEDGQKFVLTINGVPCYFGELADTYAAPYDGEARLQADGKYDLTVPAASDWYSMTINVGGAYTTYERFGGTKLQNIAVPGDGIATMIISVTDKDGNVSAETTKLFFDGLAMDAGGGYESLIPDAALRSALEAQAGPTLADLLAYNGELDLSGLSVENLSGLNLLTGLSGLDLTGTAIAHLTADYLPTSLKKLVLGGENLISVYIPERPNTALVLGDAPNCVQLAIPGYGDHELDLSGLTALTHLDLTGAALRHVDISANTALVVFLTENSAIDSMDHADAYPNAYYWNWTNSKLDLSGNTTEGELYETMKTYFATTELPEHKDENLRTLGTSGTWYNNNNADPSRTIDLGWRHEVVSLTFANAYNTSRYMNRYNVRNASVDISDDGETWTQVAVYVQEGWSTENLSAYTYQTIEFPAGTYARYVRFTTDDTFSGDSAAGLGDGYPYVASWQVDGYRVEYCGFFYAGQQPAVVRDNIATLTVVADGAEYQTLELLDAHYGSARTVSGGTYLRAIEGADWIDAAYLTAEAYAPSGVRVSIVKDGVPYVHPADTLGLVKTEKSAVNLDKVLTHGEYTNEEGWRLFDGMSSTKWCGSDSGAMWLTFELANGPEVISEYEMLHAGSESKDYIAYGYRLQVLNPEKLSEAEFLAMDMDARKTVSRDKSYWIDLSVVTGNSANETVHEIPMENLVSAQVYRFQVDGSGQPGKQTWGALRIYEMSLYAFEGTLDNVTNGMLKADEAGNYEVTYTVAKAPLASTTVTVIEPEVIVASGWSGYTTWKLNDKGVLTFSPTEQKLENGETNMKNYWKVNGVLTLPWGAYADQITKVVIEDGIHDLGQMAFYELPNLTTVQLGKDVTEIRNYAFKNCKSLTEINLDSVDCIREGAFYGCSALKDVTFAAGVVIEDWAFSKTPVVLP